MLNDEAADQKTAITSRTIIKAGFLALLFVAAALMLRQISGLLLMIFFGILLAILLDAAGRFLERVSAIPRTAATMVAAAVVVGLLVGGMVLIGPNLVAQASELGQDLTSAARRVEQWAMSIDAVEKSVDQTSVDLLQLLPSPAGLLGGVSAVLGTTFGAIANVVLILAFAIYFALAPKLYISGAVRLLPVRHRDRARDVLDEMGLTLRYWLAGKALTMLLISVITFIALTLIGVPLALLLAVIAGVTSFVPIIGPAIGGALMVLVALTESAQMAIWTMVFYAALQTLESYLLMPMIQSKAIDLPAGVVIAAQVLFGILFGTLGVVLATPLTAVAAVAIKRLYIDDVLEVEATEPMKVKAAS